MQASVNASTCQAAVEANATISPTPTAPVPPLAALVPPFPPGPTAQAMTAAETPFTFTTQGTEENVTVTPALPNITMVVADVTTDTAVTVVADVAPV